MSAAPDPYGVLGVAATASDAELRGAYRRLVQRHHPDHNGGSPESAVRFAEVQEAYAHVRLLRRTPGPAAASAASGESSAARGTGDPGLDARLAALERELGEARSRREKAARRAARLRPRERPSTAARPSDAELGYVRTEDSFGKILDDFADEVNARVSEAEDARRTNPKRGSGASSRARGVADWIDELGARLTGDHDRERDDDAGPGRSGGANT